MVVRNSVSFIFCMLCHRNLISSLVRTYVRRKRPGESRFGPDLMYQKLSRKFGIRWQKSRYGVDSDSLAVLSVLNSITIVSHVTVSPDHSGTTEICQRGRFVDGS